MKKINKTIGYGAIVPEYVAKTTAIPAGIMTLGAKGNTLEKMTQGVQNLFTFPGEFYNNATQFTQIAKDYNEQTVREFTNRYGAGAAEALIGNLNGAIEWGNQLATNIADHPFETGVAVAAVTGGLYGIGRLIRFARTKGQGSALVRLERALGDRIFGSKK